jgi:hypothetical protein
MEYKSDIIPHGQCDIKQGTLLLLPPRGRSKSNVLLFPLHLAVQLRREKHHKMQNYRFFLNICAICGTYCLRQGMAGLTAGILIPELNSIIHGMWRSLVALLVRDQKAAGSNPVIPTILNYLKVPVYRGLGA